MTEKEPILVLAEVPRQEAEVVIRNGLSLYNFARAGTTSVLFWSKTPIMARSPAA
jgi:hypothetical protein